MSRSHWCQDCRESTDTVYSDHFQAVLCSGCFNDRCYDEGTLIELEDLEDLEEIPL